MQIKGSPNACSLESSQKQKEKNKKVHNAQLNFLKISVHLLFKNKKDISSSS